MRLVGKCYRDVAGLLGLSVKGLPCVAIASGRAHDGWSLRRWGLRMTNGPEEPGLNAHSDTQLWQGKEQQLYHLLFHEILLVRHGCLLRLGFTSISFAPSWPFYLFCKHIFPQSHTVPCSLPCPHLPSFLKARCGPVREPTHGERLCGDAVANTLATLTRDATWKLQM